jgi:hypothetical protein
LKPASGNAQQKGMHANPAIQAEPSDEVIEALTSFFQQNESLNHSILAAPNAGHRMKLLREKNGLTEELEQLSLLSNAKPELVPDFPVLDIRGMEDLLAHEAQLEVLANTEPAKFSIRSWAGLVTAISVVAVTVVLVFASVRHFGRDIQPTLQEQNMVERDIKNILAEVGDKDSIELITDIATLTESSRKLSEAVRQMASSNDVDQALQIAVAERKELIAQQVADLNEK